MKTLLFILIAGVSYVIGGANAGPQPDSFVRQIEMAMNISPGTTRTDSRFGFTFEYLYTRILPDHTYAVYLKKLD